MRLTSKISLILLATVVISLLVNAFVMWQGVLPRFEALDRQAALTNADRANEALKADMRYLSAQVKDWAQWTDTHEFMQGREPEYVESNLFDESLISLDINVLYVIGLDGEVKWGMILDNEGEEFTIEELPADRFPIDHPLIQHTETISVYSGVYKTAEHPVIFASSTILNNEKEGPVAGTFIMGRVIDDTRLELLQEQTSVDFAILPHDPDAVDQNILSELASSGGNLLKISEAPADGDAATSMARTDIYQAIADASGQPAYVLHAATERDIYAAGFSTVLTVIGMLGIAGIVVLGIMWAALRVVAIKPLEEFTGAIENIGKTGSLNLRTSIQRSDEIGILSQQFDEMLERIEKARQMLLEQSFQSGVAEMAAGVLHNVRNQLNPIGLRLNRLQTTVSSVDTENIDTAFAELKSSETTAERREKLLEFVQLSSDEAASRRASNSSEIHAITAQVAKIEEVLNEQDRFTQTERVIDSLALAEIIPHAIAMMPDDVDKNIIVTIDPSIDESAPIKAERMVLTHVIQNLLMNGADAIARTENNGGEIIVKVMASADKNGVAMADIQVCDNGIGIPPEEHKHLFDRGFSTKEGAKGGTGLHWCANSVSGMGGRIYADATNQSEGAVFHILLPTAEREVASAA